MARQKNLKKGERVSHLSSGIAYTVSKDQYMYRGKPVVDVDMPGEDDVRVSVSLLKRISSTSADLLNKSVGNEIAADFNKALIESVEEAPNLRPHIVVDTSVSSFKLADTELANTASAPLGKYERRMFNKEGESIVVDVYDVLQAFEVTDPALQHLVKKALAPGQRGHKSEFEDLCDIQSSSSRAISLHLNRQQK